jgi:hypothetical protein
MMQLIGRYIMGIVWACFTVLAFAQTSTPEPMVTMRDSGYTMGDKIEMTALFTLPANQTIDEGSLPLVGHIKPWLDIQAIAFIQNKQDVRLHVTWQLFATVEIAQQLKTPEIVLKTKGKTPQAIIIPQQAFYYSPVLPMPPLNNIKRRPNRLPAAFDTSQPLVFLAVCMGLFFICALGWLWIKDLLPWLPYQPGPMMRLASKLKKQSTALTLSQLRDIHTALNQCAGISLYPENLSQLFKRAPYFACEETNITQFFHQSWSVFYPDKQSPPPIIDVAHTIEWIQHVALSERISTHRLPSKK